MPDIDISTAICVQRQGDQIVDCDPSQYPPEPPTSTTASVAMTTTPQLAHTGTDLTLSLGLVGFALFAIGLVWTVGTRRLRQLR